MKGTLFLRVWVWKSCDADSRVCVVARLAFSTTIYVQRTASINKASSAPPTPARPKRPSWVLSHPSYLTPDPSVLSCQPGLLAATPSLRPSLHPERVALPKLQVSFRVKTPTWRPSIWRGRRIRIEAPPGAASGASQSSKRFAAANVPSESTFDVRRSTRPPTVVQWNRRSRANTASAPPEKSDPAG